MGNESEEVPELTPPPALSPEDIKSAVTEALQQQQPEPEQKDDFNPETFWQIDPALEDTQQSKMLHEKIDTYVTAKVAPLEQKLNEAYAVINVMNQRKADNPDIIEAHDEAIKLMQGGLINDYSTAIEFVKLKSHKTPKPKPLPPLSASSPSVTKTEAVEAPRDKRRGMPSVFEIIRDTPAIQEAIKQGRM